MSLYQADGETCLPIKDWRKVRKKYGLLSRRLAVVFGLLWPAKFRAAIIKILSAFRD
jgi:hypothetical protein